MPLTTPSDNHFAAAASLEAGAASRAAPVRLGSPDLQPAVTPQRERFAARIVYNDEEAKIAQVCRTQAFFDTTDCAPEL